MEREKQAVFFHGTGKSGHTVPTEVPPAKVLCFTFVPAVKKLPLKTRVAQRGRHEQSLEYLGVYKEKATEETMLEDGVFKAEVVYIGHSDEDEGGDNTEHHYLNVIQGDDSTKPGPQTQLKSADHTTQALLPTLPVTAHKKKESHHSVRLIPRAQSTPTDSLNHEPQSVLQLRDPISLTARVLPSFSSDRRSGESEIIPPVSDDVTSSLLTPRLVTSPSSKESLLSEDSDRIKSWSALHLFSSEGSQASLSRTVSPCSSIKSGVFSPKIMQIKRHSLVSGPSLLQTPPHCWSPSHESLTPSSSCQMSPSATLVRSKHKTPPTQLSLLTAILRKGHLPHISVQRPFSPSWIHSPASLSSLNPSSATSSLTSVSFEVSRPQSPSAVDNPPPRSPARTHRPASVSRKCQTPPPPPSPAEVIPFSLPHALLNPSRRACDYQPSFHLHREGLSPCPPEHSGSRPSPAPPPRPATAGFQKPLNQTDTTRGFSPAPDSRVLCSSLTRQSTASPTLRPLSCFSERHHVPFQAPRVTISPAPECPQAYSPAPLHNGMRTVSAGERLSPSDLVCKLPSSPRPRSVSPPFSSRSPSPRPVSTSPNRPVLTASPASCSDSVGQSVPSPPLSSSATPSPTPKCGRSDLSPSSTESEVRNRKQYKIKSSYKALAAIPTNTLLLEQQAIDDRVEKLEVVPDNTGDERRTETHTEMCSPAQLRQESEELYAAIDQALEEPMPMRRTLSAPSSLQKLSDIDSPKQFTTLPRSAGRETKYAMSHLLPPACAPKQLTKPGVIRPVPVIPKVPEEEEEYHPNPFRQYLEEMTDLELQKHLSLPPSFLASIVSHPAFHHHLCQAGLLPGGLSLSAPLSLSHISCLIPGPYTHLSTPILPNLHTNLPRVSTLYNKITHTLLGAGRTGSNKSPGNQKLNKEKFQQNMQVPNTQELLHTAGKKEHKTQKSPSGPVGSTGTVSSSIDSAAAKTTEVRETHI
nr:PREDICTED: muscular LMNA-interacting protein isoform X2 [Lepisosteus oculatus]